DALFLGSDPFFTGRRVQLATLSARHAIPMLSQAREIVEVGGLMSYGANIADAFPQAGIYACRVPKARNPRTCRWCSRQGTSWSSTPKPPEHSASPCRRR